MSTARIGLNNGSSCVKAYGIDRSRPAIMNDYMSDYEWEQFCDEIDNALAGMNLHQTFQLIAATLTLVTFIVTFAIAFASFGTPGGSPTFAIFTLPLIAMNCAIAIVCYGRTLANKAKNEMQVVCVDTSTKQPRLSFHVRYEYQYYSRHYDGGSRMFNNGHHHHGHDHTSVHTTQYIEVSINQDTVTIPIGAAPVFATAAPTATGVGTGVTTAADRLAELDKIKYLLSPSEYEEKRTQIIKEM